MEYVDGIELHDLIPSIHEAERIPEDIIIAIAYQVNFSLIILICSHYSRYCKQSLIFTKRIFYIEILSHWILWSPTQDKSN